VVFFFVVSILVAGQEIQTLRNYLEVAEKVSRKGLTKWRHTSPQARRTFIHMLSEGRLLRRSIYFQIFHSQKDYAALTAKAIVGTLRQNPASKALVFIDALNEAEQKIIRRHIRASVLVPVIVRGIRREESEVLIRVVDAICGLVRDCYEGDRWSISSVQFLISRKILCAL